jgi:hypothetical protein
MKAIVWNSAREFEICSELKEALASNDTATSEIVAIGCAGAVGKV